MTKEELIAVITTFTMQHYQGYRLAGEAPAFALREAYKLRDQALEEAVRRSDSIALQANYRDVEEIREATLPSRQPSVA